MAKIGLPKGSGKRLKVREKSVKSQGILKWILSGNPDSVTDSACKLEMRFWPVKIYLANIQRGSGILLSVDFNNL